MTSSSILRRVAGLLFAASAAVSTTAHAADGGFTLPIGGFTRVSGSGKLQTEARKVSGFQAIALRSSMKLVLRQGAREGVELRADDNLLPLIETQVFDRNGVPTLELRMKKGTSFSTNNTIVATIDLITR